MRNIYNGVCGIEFGDYRIVVLRIREGWYMCCYSGFLVDYELNYFVMNYFKILIIKFE